VVLVKGEELELDALDLPSAGLLAVAGAQPLELCSNLILLPHRGEAVGGGADEDDDEEEEEAVVDEDVFDNVVCSGFGLSFFDFRCLLFLALCFGLCPLVALGPFEPLEPLAPFNAFNWFNGFNAEEGTSPFV